MKKIVAALFILFVIGLTSPVYAGRNDPNERWFRSFEWRERAALYDGSYQSGGANQAERAATFMKNYVNDLWLSGRIDKNYTYTVGGQVVNASDYAKEKITDSIKFSEEARVRCGGDPSAYCISGLVNQIVTSIQSHGGGLDYSQIKLLYGTGAGAGWKGGSCARVGESTTSCYYGFYSVGNLFYPVGRGQGVFAKAKEGDVFTAAGVRIAVPTLPPAGILQARAVTMATIPVTCDDIKAATPSTTMRSGTSFNLLLGAVSKGTRTQSGSTYVSWSLQPDTYRLVPLGVGTSSIRACLTDDTGSHFGSLAAAVASNKTSTFDVAYGPPPAWFQAQGGDVYAGSSISSLTPLTASPRRFLLNGAGGYPGIVTYGGSPTDYDFTSEEGTKGEGYVSYVSAAQKNWLANDTYGSRDLYNYFYSKLGNPTTADFTNLTDPLPMPAYDPGKTVYYVKGDMTTSGAWTVADGQKSIFLVDGALTINGTITITGNGFIAFIVKNNITVAPAVGVAYNATTPVVEGVYVSGGAIHTGVSSVPGAERFVGRGMFVAQDVRLERNLLSVNQNTEYAAELFIYNPGLLVTMPDSLKNVSVSWQEVAP